MIIVLSGWRGLPKTAARKDRDASQALLHETGVEVMGWLLRAWPGAHYRVGDAEGMDKVFRQLLSTPHARRELRKAGGSWRQYDADWNLYGDHAGPIRNHAMLDGDGTLHEVDGIAHQLIALPEVGEPKVKSGTWGCIKAAHRRFIPQMVLPIGERQEYAAAGQRRTRLPLVVTPLVKPLPVAAR